MIKTVIQLFCLLFIVSNQVGQAAVNHHPLTDIKQTAVDYLTSQMEINASVKAGKLDPRLRLPLCQSPLQGFVPHNGKVTGNTTIGVKCTTGQSWSIYVPVSVHIYREVAVVTHSLPRGKILEQQDFHMQRMDIAARHATYLEEPEEIIGKKLKSPIQIGQALTANLLTEPVKVRRGETVLIVADNDNFKISMFGKALSDGKIGQRIKVKNSRSNRVIEGMVNQDGNIFITNQLVK